MSASLAPAIQTESIVLWPELQADRYKPMAVEAVNIKTDEKHEGWNGVMGNAEKGEEGYVVFKIDASQEITRIGTTSFARSMRLTISHLAISCQ